MGLLRRRFGYVGHIDEVEKSSLDELRMVDPSVFPDYDGLDWDKIVAGKMLNRTIISSDDTNRIDFCDFAKEITGDYLPNVAQLLGDCVGASTEVASEHLNLVEMCVNRELQVFYQHYRPYIYGIGRVYEGKNRIRGDGSVASWQVAAIAKHGILRADLEGLPKYSKTSGREWGRSKAILDKWLPFAKDYKVRNAVQVKNFDQLCKVMIDSKMPCVIASNQGFRMDLRKDTQANKSWFVPAGNWSHQMSILACERTGQYPGARVHNQWGEAAHPGQLDGPDGTGWVTPEFFNKWLRRKDAVCFALGNFDAWTIFDEQKDDETLSPFK